MYRLPTFKGAAARQRGYGIGGIFRGLKRTFEAVVKKGLKNLGKDVKVAIKRRAVEGARKMGKNSIIRAPARKTASRNCHREQTYSN